MPELPEIRNLARQMHRRLRGLTVESVDVHQPKCLNMPTKRFWALMAGKTLGPVTSRGKWVFAKAEPGAWLLLNLGMGGDAIHHKPGEPLPEKHQVAFRFSDGSALSLRFWWFGYVHGATDGGLSDHQMTAALGLDPLSKQEFTCEAFLELLEGRRAGIKSFLLDQKHIAGIGNVYVQDILFMARLHPTRKIPNITLDERRALHGAIVEHLAAATKARGLRYEKDLSGRSGAFEDFLVAYREGSPCPECGTQVRKIRTGSTASYICPKCQTREEEIQP